MKSIIINKIEAAKVVAIVRSESSENARTMIQSLVAAGIVALEITSNTPDFCEHISWARKNYPQTLIGAGTITNVALAEQAMRANSQFIVTPNTDKDVVKAAQDGGNVTLIGAMTPTEIVTGLNYGADFIKIFPAGALGLDYFKALLGPFRGSKFIAVGGINIANVADWFSAGAIGVGVGGSFTQGSPDVIKDTVNKLLLKIK
jgi:2-dehydro-3-deoxyphosphogluconate aldolase/(4S)-4-hydroxy-2-oxoglutarate aldolase